MGLEIVKEEQKKCSKCCELKFLYEFHNDKGQKSGKRPDCRDCQKKYHLENKRYRNFKAREYRKNNVELVKLQNKKKYFNNKSKYNDLRIKNMYGITLEDYNLMFKQQSGLCAICNEHQSNFKKALFIDHCHKTGKVRGLLCHNCNTFIGHAKDDINVLTNGIKYLTQSREV